MTFNEIIEGDSKMKITYDKKAGALYIKIIDTKERLATEELVQDTVFIDKTATQQIAGIEILNIDAIEEIE